MTTETNRNLLFSIRASRILDADEAGFYQLDRALKIGADRNAVLPQLLTWKNQVGIAAHSFKFPDTMSGLRPLELYDSLIN